MNFDALLAGLRHLQDINSHAQRLEQLTRHIENHGGAFSADPGQRAALEAEAEAILGRCRMPARDIDRARARIGQALQLESLPWIPRVESTSTAAPAVLVDVDINTYTAAIAQRCEAAYLLCRLLQTTISTPHSGRQWFTSAEGLAIASAAFSRSEYYDLLTDARFFYRVGEKVFWRSQKQIGAALGQGVKQEIDRPGGKRCKYAVDVTQRGQDRYGLAVGQWLDSRSDSEELERTGRVRPLAVTTPIALDTIASIFGRDKQTIRRWIRHAGIEALEQYRQTADLSDERQPADRPDFRVSTVIDKKGGIKYRSSWHAPNCYKIPRHISETRSNTRGQGRKIRNATNAALSTQDSPLTVPGGAPASMCNWRHVTKLKRGRNIRGERVCWPETVRAEKRYMKAQRRHHEDYVQLQWENRKRCNRWELMPLSGATHLATSGYYAPVQA